MIHSYQIPLRYKNAQSFKNEQDRFEKSVAEALDMNQDEVAYYFRAMRDSPVDGEQYNALRNLMLHAKMIWGNDYHQKKQQERAAHENRLRMMEMEEKQYKQATNELLAWDIQCDKILENMNTQGGDYKPKTEFGKYVHRLLNDHGVIKEAGVFKKRFKPRKVKKDDKGNLMWPVPDYFHSFPCFYCQRPRLYNR